MSECIERLKNLGYQPDEAKKIYWDFCKKFGWLSLIEYIEKLELEEKCI